MLEEPVQDGSRKTAIASSSVLRAFLSHSTASNEVCPCYPTTPFSSFHISLKLQVEFLSASWCWLSQTILLPVSCILEWIVLVVCVSSVDNESGSSWRTNEESVLICCFVYAGFLFVKCLHRLGFGRYPENGGWAY